MSSIWARSAYRPRSAAVISGLSRCRMMNPSPGSCLGGRGRRGEGMVPTGAALTTTRRRTPAACIAPAMARVPVEAIPYSAFDRGPSADSTASAPPTAVARAAGCAPARSALTVRTSAGSEAGFRATAVTSCPAAMAWSTRWRPMPPVAAKIVSFIRLSVPSRQCEQLVHRPVVVGVLSVVRGEDRAVRADQEVRGQAQIRRALAANSAQAGSAGQASRRGTPGARLERARVPHRACAELGVELLLRVGDRGEEQRPLEAEHRLRVGVEHDDLADSGGQDLVVPRGNAPHVQVADRAAGVAAELEVHQVLGIGQAHRLAVDGHQVVAADRVSHVELGHIGPFAVPATRFRVPYLQDYI